MSRTHRTHQAMEDERPPRARTHHRATRPCTTCHGHTSRRPCPTCGDTGLRAATLAAGGAYWLVSA